MTRLRAPRAPVLWLVVVLLSSPWSGGRASGYYPAGHGLSWTYDNGVTQVMTGPSEVHGRSVMVLTHYLDGVPIAEDYLVFGPDGVRTTATAAGGEVVRFDPDLLVYASEPLQPGASWTSTTRVGEVVVTVTAEVIGLRGVQTPVGRFNALQIRQLTETSTGGQTLLDLFFVPGVGVVRYATRDGTVIDLIDRTF